MSLIKQGYDILTDPKHARWIAPLQLIGEAALCALIIYKIPYTEIDWQAYMQQIETYISGERRYTKITGATGPLVYPAMHVYIYRGLYWLTRSGEDILTAQVIFAALYIVTLYFVIQCYRAAGAPPYLLPLLSLSKRVHSIFVLRLFNDCFAVCALWGAIWCWQRRRYMVGTILYSVGLGTKMTLLLALPAVGMVLWQGVGRNRAFKNAQMMVQYQILVGWPFIIGGLSDYVKRAFEFSRTFMFKWTVNWRFLGEELFLSKPFSYSLLGTHLTLLAVFGTTRWLAPSDWSPIQAVSKFFTAPPIAEEERIARRMTPKFVMEAVLSSMIIGCLCARSLHYQFFVYIAWSAPFLLWRSKMHPVLIYTVYFAQEWAWNVYPSTNTSSAVVVGCLTVTVASVWIGTSPFMTTNSKRDDAKKKHKHIE